MSDDVVNEGDAAPAPVAAGAEVSAKNSSNAILPDAGVIAGYIRWLHGDDDPTCDVTIWGDNDNYKGPTGDRRGRLSEVLPEILATNKAGAAIGVRLATFNPDNADTTDANVTRVLALFQDQDRGALAPLEGAAHTRGRQGDHRVYRLAEPDGARYEAVQDVALRLAVKDRTDPAVTHRNQLQRLPGSLNHKASPPVLVELVSPLPDKVWGLDDLASGTSPLEDGTATSYRTWYAATKLADKHPGGDSIPDFGSKSWKKAESSVTSWFRVQGEVPRLESALRERVSQEAANLTAPDFTRQHGLEDAAGEHETKSFVLDGATARTWLDAAKQAPYSATRDWAQVHTLIRIRLYATTFGFDVSAPLPPQPWDTKTATRIGHEVEFWVAACDRYRVAQQRLPYLSANPGAGQWAASQVPHPGKFTFGGVSEPELKSWVAGRKANGRWDLETWKVGEFLAAQGIIRGQVSDGTTTYYHITCPWVDEHSGPSGESTTSIIHTSGKVPGFRCHRSCHLDKGILDVVRYWGDALTGFCEVQTRSDETTVAQVDGATYSIPAGYRITDAGLVTVRMTEAGEVETLISSRPIYITGLARDVISDDEQMTLSWTDRGQRRTLTGPRRDLADRNRIVGYSARGLPVDTEDSRDIVVWLRKFREANPDLPYRATTSVMGWTRCRKGFVAGETIIGSPEEPVTFCAGDPGTADLALGLGAHGDTSAWRHLFEAVLTQSPAGALAVYASVAPVLLELLEVAGFAVEYAGVTSTGKTTALRLAASVWGTPDECRRGSLLGTWKATRNAIERTAGCRSHLPMILDDTKGSPKAELVPQVVYDLVQGGGRGRATPGGLQQTGHWRTVVITSGEEPSATMAGHGAGGAGARTLLLWGSPFDGLDPATQKKLVDRINTESRQTYGHLGPQAVNYLLSVSQATPDDLRFLHRAESERLLRAAPGSNVANRLADSMAVLSLAGELVHRVLGLSHIKHRPIIDTCWVRIAQEAKTADVSKSAIEVLFSVAAAQRHRFWAAGQAQNTPHQGWAGRWDAQVGSDLCVTPEFVTAALAATNHDVGAAVRTWADRGWLATQGGDRRTKKVRVNGTLTNCYVIPAAVLSAQVLDGEAVTEKPEPEADEGVEQLIANWPNVVPFRPAPASAPTTKTDSDVSADRQPSKGPYPS